MGDTTLASLSQRTAGAGEDLGSLVKQLIAAAEPLEGRFNGAGKVAFDNFKAHADQISADLDQSLAAILTGQRGMDRSFGHGDVTMAEDANHAAGAAPFDAARFRGA
jgi:uncharacterized protein YukE